MTRPKKLRRWATITAALLASAVLVGGFCAPQRFRDDARRFDEGPGALPVPRLSWVLSDMTKMWRLVPLHSTGGDGKPETFQVSPTSAIRAAARVLKKEQFTGLTWDEFKARVRWNPDFENRTYTAPFQPPSGTCYVLRFDNGNFGNQYEIYFDASKRISRIEEVWIH
jgi:hypothetical protein